MKILASCAFVLLLASPLAAEVVRPAPVFLGGNSAGKAASSKEFLGRPVVLLIANSPRQWAFRSQVGQLQLMYERLSAEKIICVAAFSQTPGIVRSNIPFVTVPNGAQVASAFEADKGFAIVVIGRDGNIDYSGGKVLPCQRVYDLLNNSFAVQQSLRRQ